MQQNSARKLNNLRDFRQQKGLSQVDVAKEAGVSQSTVSRRERKPPQRHSDATYKLCNYAIKKVQKMAFTDQRKAKKLFDEVWSKSDAHAEALSKIIEAFVEFSTDEEKSTG